MNKKTYIVDISTFLYNSGGIVAMHKLCHDLNALGETSYITSPITHKALNAPYVQNRKFSKQDVVVIYPEITYGNPLQCKNVARWALNTPGRCAGVSEATFYDGLKETDLIFKYSDYFALKDSTKCEGLLTTTFVDSDYFFCLNNNAERTGSAFFVKKGGVSKTIHPKDSVNLSSCEHNWDHMGKALRSVKYFYCYDNACFWVVIAAICGCIPIVVPDSNMTADEWYSKFPHKKCGVAYGEDQLQHAIDTQPLVQQNLLEFYNKQLDTVKNFVNICEAKFL
jgi:hypothetical protein